MENIVVATFHSLQHANEGVNRLKELDKLGDVIIYNLVLLWKKGGHQFEYLYIEGPDAQAENFFAVFIDQFKEQLQTGEYGIIVDVEEDSPVIIDSYLTNYHGSIVRTTLVEDCYDYNSRKSEELDKEIDDTENKWKTGTQENKSTIKAKLDQLKARRNERREKLKVRNEQSKKQVKEKTENLRKKINTANEERKERIKGYQERLEEKIKKWNEEVARTL